MKYQLLFLTLFIFNCHLGFIRTQHAESVPQMPETKSGTKVIILTEGLYCTYDFEKRAVEESKSMGKELKCPEAFLTKKDWFPLELLLNKSGSISHYSYSELSGIYSHFGYRLKDARDILNSILSGDIFKNSTTQTNQDRIAVKSLGYSIPEFKSYDSWIELRSRKLNDAVYIYLLDPEIKHHWSYYVSLGTLGIIPGFVDSTYKTKIEYVDKRGQSLESQSTNAVVVRSWNHILFAWWSQIPYHITLKKAKRFAYEESIQVFPQLFSKK